MINYNTICCLLLGSHLSRIAPGLAWVAAGSWVAARRWMLLPTPRRRLLVRIAAWKRHESKKSVKLERDTKRGCQKGDFYCGRGLNEGVLQMGRGRHAHTYNVVKINGRVNILSWWTTTAAAPDPC